MSKILIVDGHGLVFQAYYAVSSALTAPDGTPTGAVVGVVNSLLRLGKQVGPDKVYVAFDCSAPTFRHQLSPEYKANRGPMDDDLRAQMPLIYQLVKCCGFDQLCLEGVEADDLIGTMAVTSAEQGHDVVIASSDKDIKQVLREGIRILSPRKEGLWTSAESFEADYGFPPERMADYLALVGDSSDNVAGLPGIGDKTARALLVQYGTVQQVVAHVEDFKGKRKENIQIYGQRAIETLELTKLKLDCDLQQAITEGVADPQGLKDLFEQLAMNAKTVSQLLALAQGQLEEKQPDVSTVESQPTKIFDVHVQPERPVPLAQILKEQPLALDMEGDQVSLGCRDGSWWQGAISELGDRLEDHCLICADLKTAISKLNLKNPHNWDLATAHYLLHPDLSGHDLKTLTQMEFGVERTMRLFTYKDNLGEQIKENGLIDVMTQIDLPLLPLLVNMEKAGIEADIEGLDQLIDDLNKVIAEKEEQFHQSASVYLDQLTDQQVIERFGTAEQKRKNQRPQRINPNSPKQLAELLYGVIGLPVQKKTKGKQRSTDEGSLSALRDQHGADCQIPAMLLELRELGKVLSGFAKPLRDAVAQDGKIHTSFEPQVTGTGRLSSKNPNLQNLPSYGQWAQRIGQCLIAGEGQIFVAADYSQMELRVLAHLANDPKLNEIFQSGRDFHTETAALVFGVVPEQVTKEQRRMAKTVTFGLIYGMSTYGLSARLGVDFHEAKRLEIAYFKALPGVKKTLERLKTQAVNEKVCRTVDGRIRPLDEVALGRDGGHLNRVAVNTPIQGTAADIAKKAMLRASQSLAAVGGQLVLQVHDSLVCRVDQSKAHEAEVLLIQAMTQVADLSLPLSVEVKQGKNLAMI